MKRSGTRIRTVMGEIQSRIASRTYTPGARIPSVRDGSGHAVSVSTVLEAYERLMAEGVLSSPWLRLLRSRAGGAIGTHRTWPKA
jgi:DNA-binding transcriptional MocR family regulator